MRLENRLKDILVRRGIKQVWLAEKAGVNRNTITNLVNGSEPKLSLAYKVAEALGMTVYDIWPQQ
jgi:putative transcriptional regulator